MYKNINYIKHELPNINLQHIGPDSDKFATDRQEYQSCDKFATHQGESDEKSKFTTDQKEIINFMKISRQNQVQDDKMKRKRNFSNKKVPSTIKIVENINLQQNQASSLNLQHISGNTRNSRKRLKAHRRLKISSDSKNSTIHDYFSKIMKD